MPSPIREELATLKAKMLERFEKRFLIIRARGKGENKFRPVLYADNEQQENLEKIRDFLSTSIDQAFAAGREAGLKEMHGEMIARFNEELNRSASESDAWEEARLSGLVLLDNLTKPDKE